MNDEKTRRNNASNLVNESNKWVAALSDWLTAGGLNVLTQRLGLRREELPNRSQAVLADSSW